MDQLIPLFVCNRIKVAIIQCPSLEVTEDFILGDSRVFINNAKGSLLTYLRKSDGGILFNFKDKEYQSYKDPDVGSCCT